MGCCQAAPPPEEGGQGGAFRDTLNKREDVSHIHIYINHLFKKQIANQTQTILILYKYKQIKIK